MSEVSNHIIQRHNIGLVQGVHHGDNVLYDSSATAHLTPKHVALAMHKKVMAEWKSSGTCEWLMQESNFQSWKEKDTECSFLWLYGRPGCGKSTLMSRLIENIGGDESSTNPTPLLLYFYVRYGDDQEKEKLYRSMWMTFWEQAVGKAEERAIYTFGHDTPSKIIEEELYKVLASSQRNIYMVIDAIDQLSVSSHHLLLDSLSSMIGQLRGETSAFRLRVAISSRDYNGIDQLRTHEVFPIEVETEKNQKDIDTYLEKNLTSALFQKKPQLRKQVIEELSKLADGMFLWANLQTLNLCDLEMESQVHEALKVVIPPQTMRPMYETYADGFESLEGTIKKQITQRTMALLANSSGMMSKEMILVALSLNDSGEVDPVVHRDLTADPTLVVRFCKYLVRINEKLGALEFCHKTVFEFFGEYKSTTYNRRIAELCLSHLCSSEFSQGPRNDAEWFNLGSLAPVLRQHQFLPFACSRWAISIKQSLESEINPNTAEPHAEILNLLKILFKKDSSTENKDNLQLAFQVHLLTLGKRIPKGVCHDHIVCYFGLVKLFDIFMKRKWFNVQKVDDDGLVPIHWAIRNELELDDVKLTVEKLIEYGASVNVKDKQGRTPLYYACHYGNLQVVQLLVKKHAQLNDVNKEGETALIAACRKHRHDIVPHLVNAGSDVKIQSSFGTALQAISLIGCCRCAQAILDGYGKSKIVDGDGPFGTSLHAAAFNGHAELVKLLCSRLPNTRATHPTYGSPLTAAATGFNLGMEPAPFKEIIEELVTFGINVNDRSGLVGPALRAAAYQGGEDLVRLLLEKGAKIRKAKGPMGTAYEAAAERGHQNIQNILLENDPKANRYSVSHVIKPLERHKIQRKVFRATVKTSSMDTIHRLVTQFEKFFEKEIKIGDTVFLRTLAKLGEDAFQDVIILATNSRGESPVSAETAKQSMDISRLREIISTFFRVGSTEFSYVRRVSTTFAQDGLEEHFPQVLDRMTQAAVKILEDAIASQDGKVIVLITNTWVKALNDLVSHPGFGEPMLEMVVKRRADELKQHLTNPDLSHEERFRKAAALAQVGVELLLMAVERGPRFRHLCFVISKLWIRALCDVEELGEEGELPLQAMVRIFAARLSSAVEVEDSVNAEICAQAGIELLRAAALIPTRTLLERFGSEWARLWTLALEKGKSMAYMATQLVLRRQEEYQECLKDKNKHDKAIGLALAGLGMLRQAFEQRSELAVASLLPIIESNLGLTRDTHTGHGAPAEMSIHARDQESLLDAFIKLFATGEQVQAGRLNSMASGVLTLLGTASGSRQQELGEAVKRRIDEADRLTNRSERKKQIISISRTLLALLDKALIAEERNMAIISKLEAILQYLAESLPKFTDRAELAQYVKAIEYLNSTHEQAIR